MRLAALLLFALGVGAACSGNDGSELRVFAAASLVDVFAQFETTFEAANPDVDVIVQAGGSTQLATQIVEGAPADVFAAASESAMDIVTQTPNAVFATNDLVLATPAGNPGEVEGLEDLARGELVVAVCDPAVPCGELTQAVLEDQGLEIAPDTEEPNVRAVLNKIVLDEVDAGPVYRSDAVAAGDSVNTIPIDSDRVNRYPITALSDSETARRFIDMVLSEPARATLEEAGFGAP